MDQPILHIGYHKTATTYFQQLVYPRVTNADYVRRSIATGFLYKHAFAYSPEPLREYLRTHTRQRPIICEEGLSGNLHNGGLNGFFTRAMAERLRETFPQATVVMFLRNQIDMVAAAYRQYVKEGGTYGVERYLFPSERIDHVNIKNPGFSFDHLDYRKRIQLYEELFGRRNVYVFLFEDFRRDNRAFLQRFLQRLELEFPWNGAPVQRVYNSDYNDRTLRLARALNALTARDMHNKYYLLSVPGFYKLSRTALKRLNRLDRSGKDSARLLGARNVSFIRDYYRESNRRLEAEYGFGMEAYGYPL